MACALPGEDPLSQRPGKLSCFPSNSSSCLSPTRVTLPCCGTAGATLPHCSEVTALLGFEYISGGRGGEGSGDQRLQAQLPPRLQSMLLKPWGPHHLSSGSLTVCTNWDPNAHWDGLCHRPTVCTEAPRSAQYPWKALAVSFSQHLVVLHRLPSLHPCSCLDHHMGGHSSSSQLAKRPPSHHSWSVWNHSHPRGLQEYAGYNLNLILLGPNITPQTSSSTAALKSPPFSTFNYILATSLVFGVCF